MKLSRRTLLSTPLAVVAPVGEVIEIDPVELTFDHPGWSNVSQEMLPRATWNGIPFPVAVEISFKRKR